MKSLCESVATSTLAMTAISTRLYVGGFPPDVRESELAARFAPFGKVCATQLICDSATGAPRGFGYVTLEAEEAAVERCLKVYRGTKWRGQPLHVQPANEATSRGRASGSRRRPTRRRRRWRRQAQSASGRRRRTAPLWGPHDARGRGPRRRRREPGETNAHVRTFAPPPPSAATTLKSTVAAARRRRPSRGRVRAGG